MSALGSSGSSLLQASNLPAGSPGASAAKGWLWGLGVSLAGVIGLYLTSLHSYLLFHTMAELFTVVVAFSIAVIAWNSRAYIENGYLLFVGIAYLALGLLDMLHTLGYAGMPVFPHHPFVANQLWIAARFLESLSLLAAFSFLSVERRPDPTLVLAGFVLVTGLIIASIFFWRIFPVCFVAGQGQTRFKILSEYVIIAILAVDLGLLVHNRHRFQRGIYRALFAATLLAILTEAAFTVYVSNYGPSNMVGHFLKVFSYACIYVAIVKNGVEQPYELIFRELAEANGRLTAEVAAHRATEAAREQAAEALRQEQIFSKHILESLPGIFYLYSYPELRLVMWNRQLERLLGYGPDEVDGRHILDWYPEAAKATALAAIEGVMEKGQGTLEASVIAKDGHLVPFFFLALSFEAQGRRYLMGTGIDLTERHRAEEENLRLQAQLQQAQKMESLGSLAGGVAHDMNNVLGAILGMASASIQTQAPGSSLHRSFDTIIQAATRGGKMVKGLLGFARKSPAEEREVDVNEVLMEEARVLERTTLSGVRLDLDLETGLRPVRGDASALHHAVMNLCLNGVDAMSGKGTLTLRTRNVAGNRVQVVVEDTGMGMSREVLEKAMDPFFTTKEQGKGTGLGLAMVHTTVKAHRGQIEIQSEPGVGTRVVMHFPACELARPAAEAASEAGPATPSAAMRVLVVDDDELMQSSVLMILGILGHAAEGVASGEEALATLETGAEFDAVILDMNMPGLGGAETLSRLRTRCPELPVLLATGRVDQTAMSLVRNHANIALLPKPYTTEELRVQLERLRTD